MSAKKIVTHYAKMWPREVFDIRQGRKLVLDSVRPLLNGSGVYVLYRDDQPYYVGKTARRLLGRIYAHANQPQDPYYNFWNFFSCFVVPKNHIDEVEGILIASMPTENSSSPKFTRLRLPREMTKLIANRKVIQIGRGQGKAKTKKT